MDYVKGLVAAGATKNKEECIRHATEAAQMFIKEHGATRLVECWGEMTYRWVKRLRFGKRCNAVRMKWSSFHG